MADLPQGPNIDTSYLYRQSQQAQGGSGSMPIFMGARIEQNVGTGLSIQGKGLNGDGMVNKLPKAAPGPLAKLLEGMGLTRAQIFEGLAKVSQAGPVQSASISDITGNSHGLGDMGRGGGMDLSA